MKRLVGGLCLAALALGVAAAPLRDGVTIVDTGSTNALGYTIKLWSDGAARVGASNKSGTLVTSTRPFSVPGALAVRTIADARAARDAGAAGHSCVKSASFGTAKYVRYHAWTSADLTCPPFAPALAALATDVAQVEKLAGLEKLPKRMIHLMPNEPRRVPDDGGASPSPSPNR